MRMAASGVSPEAVIVECERWGQAPMTGRDAARASGLRRGARLKTRLHGIDGALDDLSGLFGEVLDHALAVAAGRCAAAASPICASICSNFALRLAASGRRAMICSTAVRSWPYRARALAALS